ncbi:ribosome silencing factor [Leptothrix discophora]|uniref:Ribosomal silencing factor RsfS n=1 Tax=Leptothrix discophora TaxID=89 RepID=A0ABT9FZL7_LEPDI|nr:ribosome silencing factor [Leptothrix discophora]MDP4299492.1 ribosome silencing factor [Leptothrix discophora]
MDIRKLQRAIVDGLEDVKAQDIVVFNTEHLSPLFERVVIASGTSNRQANALAASVRDAVRSAGGQVLSTEGGDNGEWIIVDCGAAVVHVMQPAIRQYYHLEEIWGGKQVRIKLGTGKSGLVKASEPVEEEDETPAPAPKRRSARAAREDHLTEADNAVRASQTRVDDDEDELSLRGAARPARKTSKTAARKPASKTAPNAGKADAPGTAVGRKAVARKTTGRRAPTNVQSLVVLPEGKVLKRKAPATAVKTATQTTARKAAARKAAPAAAPATAPAPVRKAAAKAPAKTAAKPAAPKAAAKNAAAKKAAPARKRST